MVSLCNFFCSVVPVSVVRFCLLPSCFFPVCPHLMSQVCTIKTCIVLPGGERNCGVHELICIRKGKQAMEARPQSDMAAISPVHT